MWGVFSMGWGRSRKFLEEAAAVAMVVALALVASVFDLGLEG